MSAGDRSRLPHLPALDGLRAIAVASVFAYHADVRWAQGGFLGVDVFFVISGFLITALLLSEWREHTWLDVASFWKRRALRLLPALFVLLVAVWVAVPLLAADQAGRLQGDIRAALAYVSNWRLIFEHQSYFEAAGRPPLLQHLWSLAVEEQFYLVWPLILWAGLAVKRRLVWWILAGAAASAGLMALLYTPGTDPSRVYYGTDTRAGAILLGAALACVWKPWESRRTVPLAGRAVLAGAGVAALGGLAWCVLNLHQFSDVLYRGGFLGVAGLAAVLIAVIAHPSTPVLGATLGCRPMVWLGKRSYGIYLFYWPVIMLTRSYYDVPLAGNALLALRTGITISLAALSYRLVESPVRNGALGRLRADIRRRRRAPFPAQRGRWVLARAGVAGMAALAVGATVVVASPAPAPPDFLAIQAAGAAAPAPETTTTATTLAPTTTTSVLATTSTVAPTTTIAAPTTTRVTVLPQARVIGLGDSVLLEAKTELERRLPDASIDAVVGRQFKELLALAESLRAVSQLGEEVILQLGNNGPVTSSQFSDLMEVLRGVRRVVVINVKVPRAWEAPNNAMLAENVPKWPNATLVDWHKQGAAHPEFFGDDGTHMGLRGVGAFVELILANL